ncbi:MAG TPA: BlaI/MecI/CopY family transcriptional regulator [Terriglobia bacterium]|nr:BlaI/MecI/CopY family transcriptional regulator [Terriglobia bacterium]
MARKTRNHRLDLPPLELDCMRALWALGQATVHEVRARLFPERALAYTTVMTVMDHLRGKGLVERERRGRPFVYRSLVTEDAVREHALDRLTRNFFVNSRDQLRNYLISSASPVRTPEPPPEPRAPAEAPELRPPAERARPRAAAESADSRREPERIVRIDTTLL